MEEANSLAIKLYINECSSNNLSVVVVDLESNKIVAAVLSKDFTFAKEFPIEVYDNVYVKLSFKLITQLLQNAHHPIL